MKKYSLLVIHKKCYTNLKNTINHELKFIITSNMILYDIISLIKIAHGKKINFDMIFD